MFRLPEPLAGRDCSCHLLTRVRSIALLKLVDRERAREQADAASLGEYGSNATTRAMGAPLSPSRTRRSQRGPFAGGVGASRPTADMLQELYLKARIREAEEAKRKEEEDRELHALRQQLGALPTAYVEAAIGQGWDGLQEAIERALGDGAWARAVNSVPDDWEEEEALEALADMLRRPMQSEHALLLLTRD